MRRASAYSPLRHALMHLFASTAADGCFHACAAGATGISLQGVTGATGARPASCSYYLACYLSCAISKLMRTLLFWIIRLARASSLPCLPLCAACVRQELHMAIT